MNRLHKLWFGTCAYGLVRNSIVATQIPLKKDELYSRRVLLIVFASMGTPLILPALVMGDLGNIERKMRGMKTEHTVPFI